MLTPESFSRAVSPKDNIFIEFICTSNGKFTARQENPLFSSPYLGMVWEASDISDISFKEFEKNISSVWINNSSGLTAHMYHKTMPIIFTKVLPTITVDTDLVCYRKVDNRIDAIVRFAKAAHGVIVAHSYPNSDKRWVTKQPIFISSFIDNFSSKIGGIFMVDGDSRLIVSLGYESFVVFDTDDDTNSSLTELSKPELFYKKVDGKNIYVNFNLSDDHKIIKAKAITDMLKCISWECDNVPQISLQSFVDNISMLSIDNTQNLSVITGDGIWSKLFIFVYVNSEILSVAMKIENSDITIRFEESLCGNVLRAIDLNNHDKVWSYACVSKMSFDFFRKNVRRIRIAIHDEQLFVLLWNDRELIFSLNTQEKVENKGIEFIDISPIEKHNNNNTIDESINKYRKDDTKDGKPLFIKKIETSGEIIYFDSPYANIFRASEISEVGGFKVKRVWYCLKGITFETFCENIGIVKIIGDILRVFVGEASLLFVPEKEFFLKDMSGSNNLLPIQESKRWPLVGFIGDTNRRIEIERKTDHLFIATEIGKLSPPMRWHCCCMDITFEVLKECIRQIIVNPLDNESLLIFLNTDNSNKIPCLSFRRIDDPILPLSPTTNKSPTTNVLSLTGNYNGMTMNMDIDMNTFTLTKLEKS